MPVLQLHAHRHARLLSLVQILSAIHGLAKDSRAREGLQAMQDLNQSSGDFLTSQGYEALAELKVTAISGFRVQVSVNCVFMCWVGVTGESSHLHAHARVTHTIVGLLQGEARDALEARSVDKID